MDHGSALGQHGIRRGVADGHPIYVETKSGGNADFYKTVGFDVLEEIVIKAIDLLFTLLLYRPGY